MNMNRIVQMIMRQVMSRGINAGIDRVAGGGKQRANMTPEERAQAKRGQENGKRAKQMAKLTRRFGKF